MLSWSKTAWTTQVDGTWREGRSWSAKTTLGTAVIHQRTDGSVLMDMWKPDLSNIGRGLTATECSCRLFPTVGAAMTRAESILDPRATWYDLVDSPMFDEEYLEAG